MEIPSIEVLSQIMDELGYKPLSDGGSGGLCLLPVVLLPRWLGGCVLFCAGMEEVSLCLEHRERNLEMVDVEYLAAMVRIVSMTCRLRPVWGGSIADPNGTCETRHV